MNSSTFHQKKIFPKKDKEIRFLNTLQGEKLFSISIHNGKHGFLQRKDFIKR